MPPPLLLDSLALSFSNALFPILPLEPSFRRLARASAGESLVVLRGGLGGGGAPLLKDRWGEWWHEFRVALAVRVRRANNINNCAWWFGWWWWWSLAERSVGCGKFQVGLAMVDKNRGSS